MASAHATPPLSQSGRRTVSSPRLARPQPTQIERTNELMLIFRHSHPNGESVHKSARSLEWRRHIPFRGAEPLLDVKKINRGAGMERVQWCIWVCVLSDYGVWLAVLWLGGGLLLVGFFSVLACFPVVGRLSVLVWLSALGRLFVLGWLSVL